MKEEIKRLVEEWLRKADRNLIAAKHELMQDEPITENICFNYQQATEKYLKAFLVAKQIHFNKTHDIKEVLTLCIKENPDFESLSDVDIEELTDYAVDIRYPGFVSEPSKEEAEKAVRSAEATKELVYKALREMKKW
jgi:HEPN domain-containing protein